jgi:hypothetical protein
MAKASKVISYSFNEQLTNEQWEEKRQELLKRKKAKESILEGHAEFMAGSEKELKTMYYIAYQATYKKIPARDIEDIVQEIVTAYIAKEVKEEYLLHLIAKEKVVQYYRRGRIENRNYRNILMTRNYYQYDEKTGQVSWTSKYDDSDIEEVNYEIALEQEGTEEFEEIALDRIFIQSLPKRHRELAFKRFSGEKLTDSERAELSRYQRRLREGMI